MIFLRVALDTLFRLTFNLLATLFRAQTRKGPYMKFHVPDMSFGHCTTAITKEIASLDPQAKVTADLETRTVEVTTPQPDAAVIDAIKAAGYEAAPV